MYARIRTRWGRRSAVAAAAVALVVVLGACETDDATDVRPTQAALNAKGRCYKGLSGWSRFQLRPVGGTFAGVADRHIYNCSADTGVFQFTPKTVGGLSPGTTYEFRLRTELDNGAKFWTDSVGTQNGTNYDRFRTPAQWEWEMVCLGNPSRAGCEGAGTTSGEDDADYSIQCEDGAVVCASARQRECKGKNGNPLNHFMFRTSHYARAYEAESRFSWCWKNGNVIRSTISADANDCDTTLWGYTNGWWVHECRFVYSECTPNLSSCLYQHKAVFMCCKEPTGNIPVTIPFKRTHCLGTRICAYRCATDGSGAYHSRNPDHDRDCPA